MRTHKGKKAILMSRVSTTDQKDNGYSLPQQKEFLHNYCNLQDIEVIKYLEEDHTGTTLDRPKIKELKQYISKNKIDLILFHKWDRFSRKTSQALVEIENIQRKGIEINAIAEYIDFNVPQQKMMLIMYLGLGEVENEVRSKRTKNGIIGALKEGRHVNKAPIGYINGKDPQNPNKPLIKPCPIKAPLIKMIFEEYTTGFYSQESLRKKYYKKGIKRCKSQFSNLLSNVIYTGKIIVPQHDDFQMEIREALHAPIVDEVLFTKAQKIKYGKANVRLNIKANNKHSEKLPLRGGILKCNNCGSNLTGSPSKSRNGNYHYYYHCNRKKGCKENFSAIKAHTELEKLLFILTPSKEVVTLFTEILKDRYKTNFKDREKEAKKLSKNKVEIEEKLDNLTEKFVSDSIDKSSYDRLSKKYNAEINNINIELSELSNTNKDLDSFVEFGTQLLISLDIYYKKANSEIKKRILGSIFSEKLVFSENKYRTAKLNEAVSLIFNYNKRFEDLENKKRHSISKVSCSVAGTGLEPVTFGL